MPVKQGPHSPWGTSLSRGVWSRLGQCQLHSSQLASLLLAVLPTTAEQSARCFYHFFMIVVVIRYKTKATAHRALAFIVRIFVNDTIAIAVWTSFHECASNSYLDEVAYFIMHLALKA